MKAPLDSSDALSSTSKLMPTRNTSCGSAFDFMESSIQPVHGVLVGTPWIHEELFEHLLSTKRLVII
jgi:hypothetical protein